MDRKKIEEKYKWDLTALVESDEAYLNTIDEIAKELPTFKKFKGKLNDKDVLLECFEFDSMVSKKIMKLYAYAMQTVDQDSRKSESLANLDRITNLYSKYALAISFISPEMAGLDENYLGKLEKDSDFANFDIYIKEVLRVKEHTLSDKEEALLARGSEVLGSFSDIFNMTDNADMKFGTIKDENGEESELNHAKYGYFLSSEDREVRKNAYNQYYEEYKKLIHTISATYIGNVKKDIFLSRARGFSSCLERAMFYEHVDKKVYENLLNSVEKELPTMYDYVSLRKKLLGTKDIRFYDLYVSLFPAGTLKVPYEEAFDIVKKALKPLGEDYITLLQEAYDNKWIDAMPNDGKRSGAYSNAAFGVHPYVLLNYEKTTHNVFTLAHELGHAMHSYFSNSNQPFEKADYTIFVAEVASTVNEVLLLRYLINNTDDKEMKKFCLNYFLDMFRTTLFRQTMFAEFEYVAHNKAENDIPLTYEMLTNEYEALNKKYYGEEIIHDDNIKYEWARIPHFYRSFYVYKYATGITSAITIAYNILEQGDSYVAKYKKFLSSGSTMKPTDLLKIADCDLETTKPFENAMKVFNSTLKELKELV